MKCPYCNVPLLEFKECPKCKWDIHSVDGGPKHLQWLKNKDEKIEEERLAAEEKKRDSEKAQTLEQQELEKRLIIQELKTKQMASWEDQIAEDKSFFVDKPKLMTTSASTFEGYSIVDYIGYCFAESIIGAECFNSTEIRDIYSFGSFQISEKLSEAEHQALNRLYQNCIKDGANAIINLKVEKKRFVKDLISITASGVAVKILK